MPPHLAATWAALALTQWVPPTDASLGDVYLRTQQELSRQAQLPGDSTVLGYDRGVTVLVRQYSALVLEISAGKRRLVELAAASEALASLDPNDLTEQGSINQSLRLGRAAAEVESQAAQLERSCQLAATALAELKGRLAGKLDSLEAAQTACASLGPAAPPKLCSRNAETAALYQTLLLAARREEPGLRAACQPRTAARK